MGIIVITSLYLNNSTNNKHNAILINENPVIFALKVEFPALEKIEIIKQMKLLIKNPWKT
jgi:hypothetical protein